MRIADTALRAVKTVGPDASVAEVARIMLADDARAVVIEADGRAAGIVTERDILARVVSRELAFTTPVERVMTPDPVTVDGSVTTAEAYLRLRDHGVRQIPVTHDGSVIGLVGLADLVGEVIGDVHRSGTAYRYCPHCGSEQLRPVNDGETTNLLCLECRQCWHPERGFLRHVDPHTCPGCPDRTFCQFPTLDR